MFLFTEQEEGHAQLGPGWTRRTSAFLMILISVKTQRRQTVSLLSDLFSTHLPKLPSQRESASTDRESMRQLLVAERALGGKERCLGDYGKLKVSYPTEKYTWEKKIGDVETGRERKILWQDFPGHFASRLVQKPDGDGDSGKAVHQGGAERTPEALHRPQLQVHLAKDQGSRLCVTHSRSALPMSEGPDSTRDTETAATPVSVDEDGRPVWERTGISQP